HQKCHQHPRQCPLPHPVPTTHRRPNRHHRTLPVKPPLPDLLPQPLQKFTLPHVRLSVLSQSTWLPPRKPPLHKPHLIPSPHPPACPYAPPHASVTLASKSRLLLVPCITLSHKEESAYPSRTHSTLRPDPSQTRSRFYFSG